MSSLLVFHTSQVAGFVREGNDPAAYRSITIYPNAHDQMDSISIQWAKTPEDAEKLAADILAAAKAVREVQADEQIRTVDCPACGAAAGAYCTEANTEHAVPNHTMRRDKFNATPAVVPVCSPGCEHESTEENA